MRKRDWNELNRYVRLIANEVGLRDWTIALCGQHLKGSDSRLAHVDIVYGRKLATITLRETFRGESRDEQRNTIVHELVHCHLESAAGMVRDDLEEHLGKQSDRLFWEGFRRQFEYGVDAIASEWARKLPLIEWPKGKHGHAS